MSNPTRCTSNRVATIWPIIGKDAYTGLTYGSPYTIQCTFEQGSSRQYRNAQGTMYIPASIYWYEFNESVGLPNLNDFIALGNHLTSPTPQSVFNAETIKNRIRQDCSLLGDVDDVMVLT